MAKIALRAYNREIETLVERGQIEEAIAHSKYIMRFFPKYVETYRLLGKAYIESQRYSEAADILQRILSVLPDDFVSQIGMSIIREDEGNLDAAIFHMERAHEIQPSNVAVQDELRRLYGRRDGVEPPRLRLTRGALVRLYAKGDLHRQAIAEIRAALAEDPSRYDLEVILARMYFLLGQKVEATDIASRLVSRLPYCLEANRVLADVLPATSRAEDAKVYQQRVYALDPYLAYISPNAPTVNLVPDNAVTLDRLDWQPSITGEAEPAWAQDVGITLGEEKEAEATSDWLSTTSEREPAAGIESPESSSALSSSLLQGPSEAPQAQSSPIPDWMQASGWGEAGAATQEAVDNEAVEEAAPAELPDWLKEMAPAEEGTVPPLGEDAKLDWLDAILPPVADVKGEEPATPESEQILSEESIATGFDLQESQPQAAEEALPDWLTFTPSETLESPETSSELTPEAELSPSQPEATTPPSGELPVEQTGNELVSETALFAQDETPITGLHFESSSAEATLEPAPATELEITSSPEAKLPAAPTAEIETSPPVSAEELAGPTTEMAQEPPVDFTSPAAEPELPVSQAIDEPSAALPAAAAEGQPELNDLDAAMAWLESLAAKQGADQETLSTPLDQRTETPPEWVSREIELAESEGKPAESIQPLSETASQPESLSAIAEEATSQIEPAEIEPEIAEPEANITDEPGSENSISPQGTTSASNLVARFAGLDSETTQSIPQDAFENNSLYPFKEFSAIKPVETAPETELSEPEKMEPAVEDQYTKAEKKTSPLGKQEQPVPQDEMEADANFAWLEALAAQQGADEGTLSTPPEDRLASAPAWVLEQASEPTELTDASDLLQGTMALEEPAGQEQETGEPDAIPDWFKPAISSLPPQEEETNPIIPPTEPAEWVPEPPEMQFTPEILAAEAPLPTESQPAPQSEEPLPTWLQGFDQAAEEPTEEVKPASVEDLPDWLKDFETPAEAPLTQASDESISVSSWLREQDVPAGEQPEQSTPAVEDTQPVKLHPPQPVLEVETSSTASSVPPEKVKVEEPFSEGRQSVEDPVLSQAQTAMQDGKIDQALTLYNNLIEQGQYLDEIVHDLRDSLYRYPVDIAIWQTLGDAYIRSNHIQEALDAYTKAEELLK